MARADDPDARLRALDDERLGLVPVDQDPPVPAWASARAERRRTNRLVWVALLITFGPALVVAAAILLRG